jgi:hypothetical protein
MSGSAVEGVKRRLAVIVGFDLEPFGFQSHRDGSQDVPVIVDKGDPCHGFPILPVLLVFVLSGMIIFPPSGINRYVRITSQGLTVTENPQGWRNCRTFQRLALD